MNFTPAAFEMLSSRATLLASPAHPPVIDADTHLSDPDRLPPGLKAALEASPDYFHGRPIDADDLRRELRMSRVDMALIWQNPAATPYTADPEANFEVLFAANRTIFECARRHPETFIPAGWTDPKALGLANALRMADICIGEFGFAVVKMNPAQNAYPITSEEVLAVTERIAGHGAVTAFHFGADTPYTPAEGLEAVARTFPEAPFLAVHMGGGGAGYVEAEPLYLKTRYMGLRNPNIRFILSARRDTHAESDLIVFQQAGEPFCRNLLCGSDAPYGRVSWNFGGYRAMLSSLQDATHHPDPRVRRREVVFSDDAVRGYLGGNCARLVQGACEEVIRRSGLG